MKEAMHAIRKLVAVVGTIVITGCSAAGSPSPSRATSSPAATPAELPSISVAPEAVVASGTCNPTFEGVCSRVDVSRSLSITYTPVIPCSPKVGGETCQLAMDITAPTSAGPWPLIVFLVGGRESPAERYPDYYGPFAEAVAGQGAVVMVTGWRVGTQWGGGYPKSFQDAACAIGVARRIGPAYGANPDEVILVGSSNGGWPAVITGLTPGPFTPAPGSCDPTAGSLRPDAVVSMAGTVNYRSPDPEVLDFVEGFLGGDRDARPTEWAGADEFALAKRYPAGAHAIPFLLDPRAHRSQHPAGRHSVVRKGIAGCRLQQPTYRDPQDATCRDVGERRRRCRSDVIRDRPSDVRSLARMEEGGAN